MNKKTPILVVGYGSIGARHYRNLLALGYTNVRVFDIDAKKLAEENIPAVEKLTPETCRQFMVAFICNPTTEHVRAAALAAQASCHLFIEKPLSHTSKNIEPLLRIAKKNNVTAMVACNIRFHRGFERLEKLLESKKLGKPLTASATFSRDLGRPRLGVDYRKTYAAGSVGGGVILDLGAHIVEYLSALFGDIPSVVGVTGNQSSLKIAAEDYAAGVMRHQSGVVSSYELDYFRTTKKHSLEVVCEKGTVVVDFVEDTLCWSIGGAWHVENVYPNASPDERRNDMYQRELAYFLSCIDKKKEPLYNLSRAARVTKVLESMQRSGKDGKRITIGD